MEKISPLHSNPTELPKPGSRKKHTVSGVALIRRPHKEPLNRPNVAGFAGAKPERKRCTQRQNAVAQRKQRCHAVETCCPLCGETYNEVWIQCQRCKN
jgi:hypothetical protein